MPVRHIDEADLEYYLVLFDKGGVERKEADGRLFSRTVARAAADGVTDVFISSHGWKGDIPAAIRQYDRWIGAMARLDEDRRRVRALDPNFKALIVGVHWPSLPWGEEDVEDALLSGEPDDGSRNEFAVEQSMDDDRLVELYASRIADTPVARSALRSILAAAHHEEALLDEALPAELEDAYRTLFSEAGLQADGPGAAPGSDLETFDPAATMVAWERAAVMSDAGEAGTPGLLGIDDTLNWAKEKVLATVRQISFWTMKRRARIVGETGVHSLLASLEGEAPTARFHLMGHSFGCIVVTAAIAGPMREGEITSRLPRPVESLFLVQGAMSLWSLADAIPFLPGVPGGGSVPGYYRALQVEPALVSGPIVTTQSSFDRAVGTFFPLGAEAGGELTLDATGYPRYGAVGTFGIQGSPLVASKLPFAGVETHYGFEPGYIYNMDASSVIRRGGGVSGAHSDIAHPEIAHLFWDAALTSIRGR